MVSAAEDKPQTGPKKDGKKEQEPDLSPEDLALKDNLDMLVARVLENDEGVALAALEAISTEIRTATSSMTSVPKPLEFLMPHYKALRAEATSPLEGKARLRPALMDTLSVLAVTGAEPGSRDALRFRVESGRTSAAEVTGWGAEYLRHLAGEIGAEFADRRAEKEDEEDEAEAEPAEPAEPAELTEPAEPAEGGKFAPSAATLRELALEIVPYHVSHASEPEAVDLLLEVDAVAELPRFLDAASAPRALRYLAAAAPYLAPPDGDVALEAIRATQFAVGDLADSARTAFRLRRPDLAAAAFARSLEAGDKALQLQIAHVAAAAGETLPLDGEQAAVPPGAGDAQGMEEEGGVSGDGAGAPASLVPPYHAEPIPAVPEDGDGGEWKELLKGVLSNASLSERYLALARDLDVLEPKAPEDVYKGFLPAGGGRGAAVDSARSNLASTFVNAFVNAGFGTDSLVSERDSGSPGEGGDTAAAADAAAPAAAAAGAAAPHWVWKNRDHGRLSAAASLGAINLHDVEGGLPALDRFLYASDPQVVGGALLGVGLATAGVSDEVDPALAILGDYLTREETPVRVGAALGLGLAYAGTRREDVSDLLAPLAGDAEAPLEVAAHAALAVGLVMAGTGHAPSVQALLQALLLRPDEELSAPGGTLIALGVALLFLLRREDVEPALEVAHALPPAAAGFLAPLLEASAYAGSGDVLVAQRLLARVTGGAPADATAKDEAKEPAKDSAKGADHEAAAAPAAPAPAAAADPAAPASAAPAAAAAPAAPTGDPTAPARPAPRQRGEAAAATLGLALVAGGEPLGAQMARGVLEHTLRYGEPGARAAAPLALALLSPSDADPLLTDALGRLCHDTDSDVSAAAALALGIVGAGTNNARLATLLRQLGQYHQNDGAGLFLCRISLGLVHAGKGLLTLDPWAARDPLAPRRIGPLAALLAVAALGVEARVTIAARHHHLLYLLLLALSPRWLSIVDEAGKPLPVQVRVGKAVDVAGTAGRPSAVTGFQTHTTPVLLAAGEKAELGTDKYLPRSTTLEGIVVVTENPDYVERAE